tara:strand:- start:305 stop:694 length:390 start_codon:yes stop_codon:yes gene_type:complete
MSDLETRIEKMVAEIQSLDTRLVKFKEFTQELERNSTHFTEEEIDLAKSHSRELEEECTTQREILASKMAIYEDKIVNLSKTIEIRKKIIEKFETSGAFGENDGIFNTMVHNHAKLTNEYSEAKKLLEE